MQQPFTPLSVWSDFDHSWFVTEVDPHRLPPWKNITEHMKAHLGFLIGLEFGSFSLSANLHPRLQAEWVTTGQPIPKLIQRRLNRELNSAGLGDLPYFYVIEGRSRTGKSRTRIHIHGYAISEDRLVATKLKMALEGALRRNDQRRIQRQRGVEVEDTDACMPARWSANSCRV
jgi:hypothetical protein